MDTHIHTQEEYKQFIQNQYKESQEQENNTNNNNKVNNDTTPSQFNMSSSASKASTEEEDRFFRPVPGFSIAVKTFAGDGLKIRGEGEGKVLFINFCR
jgi:hypothetical protein